MTKYFLNSGCDTREKTIKAIFQNHSKCKDCRIKRRTIFSGLNTTLFDKPSTKQLAYFEMNSVIIQPGNTQSHLYCIREGWCRIVYGNAGEKSSTLWYAGPGDLLGLSSICSGEKNSFSVIAIDNVTACRVSATYFQQLLPKVKGLPLRVAKQLSSEIERLEKRTAALHRRFIQKETAKNILNSFKKSDSGKGKKISLLLLAKKINASKNEIKDSLTAFVLDKLIRHEEGKIIITDKDRLLLVAMNEDEWD